MAQRNPLTAGTARTVHFLLVMTITAAVTVCWVQRDSLRIDLGAVAAHILRYSALAELVIAGVVIARLRAGVQLLSPTEDVAAWWAANGMRVLATWVICYSVAITGASLWLVTEDYAILGAVVLAAILLLMRLSPSRWVVSEPEHQSRLRP